MPDRRLQSENGDVPEWSQAKSGRFTASKCRHDGWTDVRSKNWRQRKGRHLTKAASAELSKVEINFTSMENVDMETSFLLHHFIISVLSSEVLESVE